jgi:3'-phosphoadenosine 5'-phosphosulfate sulfotransferase (PAPS reductase)/FAD synthetase
MYLALSVSSDIPVVYMNSGYALSDTYKYRDWYIDNIGIKNYYEVPCPEDYIELCLKYGLPSIDRTSADHDKVIKIIKKDILDEYAREQGWNCCIWGIRAEETRGRKILLKQRGLLYNQNGIAKCSPIGWWKGIDVWAAIDALKIPYNPIYDRIMPPFFTRETIKNSGWLTTDKATKGRLVWLKRYYYNDYIKLLQLFPEVQFYV